MVTIESARRGVFGPPTRSLSENPIFGGCWKMFRYKASEFLRNEAYLSVRRSDEE